RTGNLERHLRRIHFVIAAKTESGFDVHHLVAGQHSAFHRLLDSLVHRLDVLARHNTAHYRIDELVARAGLERLYPHFGVAVLTPASRLPYELADALGHLCDRLSIRHLRTTHVGVDSKLALQPIDDDLQMQFAHAADDRLAGLLIRRDLEAGILGRKTLKSQAQLLLIGSCLWLDRLRDDRRREFERFEDDRSGLFAD